jgi:hypothetical protein
MAHCELWLESANGVSRLRVALLAPEDFEIPDGFTKAEVQKEEDSTLYVSDWFDGIKPAKSFIDEAAQFYSDKDLKFLYFREIRKPQT